MSVVEILELAFLFAATAFVFLAVAIMVVLLINEIRNIFK